MTERNKGCKPVALGRYTLEKCLAIGGMAEIFFANHRGPGGFTRDLVVKRILPHLASDQDFVEMFQDEARIAARLSHPNIVPVHDFGEVDGTWFLAMELVRGPDLRSIIDAGKKTGKHISFPVRARIIADAAQALEHAHRQTDAEGNELQIIHRDVSPSNIIVSYDGVTKLIDFGIAKANQSIHKTKTGFIKGKIVYMSPEQIYGEPLDYRADVYSLGAVLFELCTAQAPYTGDSDLTLMRKILDDEPPAPRNLVPDIPPQLETIILKAISRDRDKRHESARQVAMELEDYIVNSVGNLTAGRISEEISSLKRAYRNPMDVLERAGIKSGTGRSFFPESLKFKEEPPEDKKILIPEQEKIVRTAYQFNADIHADDSSEVTVLSVEVDEEMNSSGKERELSSLFGPVTLSRILSDEEGALSDVDPGEAEYRLKRITMLAGDLPTPPDIATEIIRLVADPDTSIKNLQFIIARDQGLAARVLKIANSSLFGLRGSVTTLSRAIVMLGFNTLQSIVVGASTEGYYRQSGSRFKDLNLWEHANSVALTSRFLAGRYLLDFVEEAYVGGLLHDLGKIPMERRYGSDYSKVFNLVQKEGESFADAEKKIFGFTHAEVGEKIFQKWGFSEILNKLVRYHHQPSLSDQDSELCAIVNLADNMCVKYGIGPSSRPDLDLNALEAASILGISESEIESISEKVQDALEAEL